MQGRGCGSHTFPWGSPCSTGQPQRWVAPSPALWCLQHFGLCTWMLLHRGARVQPIPGSRTAPSSCSSAARSLLPSSAALRCQAQPLPAPVGCTRAMLASAVLTQNVRFPLPLQLRRGGLPDARGVAAVCLGREVPAPPGMRQRGTARAAQEQKWPRPPLFTQDKSSSLPSMALHMQPDVVQQRMAPGVGL